MHMSLTPHLEAMVRETVASGRDSNKSEDVREALWLMDEREKLDQPRVAVAVDQAQIRRGAGIIEISDYGDADQVVGEALRQLEEREHRLIRPRAAIAVGDADIARGGRCGVDP